VDVSIGQRSGNLLGRVFDEPLQVQIDRRAQAFRIRRGAAR
jgi:hypothetical protein